MKNVLHLIFQQQQRVFLFRLVTLTILKLVTLASPIPLDILASILQISGCPRCHRSSGRNHKPSDSRFIMVSPPTAAVPQPISPNRCWLHVSAYVLVTRSAVGKKLNSPAERTCVLDRTPLVHTITHEPRSPTKDFLEITGARAAVKCGTRARFISVETQLSLRSLTHSHHVHLCKNATLFEQYVHDPREAGPHTNLHTLLSRA